MQSDLQDELVRVARDTITHAREGTITRTDGLFEVAASQYRDPARFVVERDRIFRRLPLALAMSAELPDPGDYRTMEVAGVPVLLTRDSDGAVRAMLNICTHRANFVAEGCGSTARFTCPFHGWTFNLSGKLIGVAARADFGSFDRGTRGLTHLPVLEKAGIIWVIVDPASTLDIAAFLHPFADFLDGFDFANMHVAARRTLKGSNWKLAIEAHLDWYHLPVLHRDSFGSSCSNRALYYSYGPHVRMTRPAPEHPPAPPHLDLLGLEALDEAEWGLPNLLLGGWIAFPATTIYTLHKNGRRIINLNQIFPGDGPDSSWTIQTYLLDGPPTDEKETLTGVFDFVERVVREEDLPTSAKQQRAIASGLVDTLIFGENEGGCIALHQWIDRIIAADDPNLDALFRQGAGLDCVTG